MNRRNFLKKSSILGSSFFLPDTLLGIEKKGKFHFIMPPKPFEYFIKEGKKKGGKVLIIGGIHGNEEGGYKASDILLDMEISQGTIAVLPRSNPESIFTDTRGYNGDMNRKFSRLSKLDSDYYKVNSIKNFIADFKPDIILSLHDGYGFYTKYKNQWGESIVIDENIYKNINLHKTALFVSENLKKQGFNIPINNTKTFQKNTKHKEQRKSLTYYALETHNVPAFCIEASKQTSLKRKTLVHILAMEQFFKIYNVKFKQSFQDIVLNIDTYLKPKKTQIIATINNQKKIISNHTVLKIPEGSEIKFEVANNRSGGMISKNVNVNYKSFYYKSNITFDVKSDNLTDFNFKIIKG